MGKADWYEKPEDRLGIAFGMEELDRARATRSRVLPHLRDRQDRSRQSVELFVAEARQYFVLAD